MTMSNSEESLVCHDKRDGKVVSMAIAAAQTGENQRDK